jgi:hypothetical protein
MKHLLQAFLFLFLLSFQKSSTGGTNKLSQQVVKKYYTVADTSVRPNYGDLNVFWTDFKKYALANNVKKLAEMTAFKFMNQNTMLSKEDFLRDFTFMAPMKGLRKVGPPKYTKDKVYDYDTNKYLGHSYSAVVGGALLLFCKIRGLWKFTGVNYGE